MSRAASLSRAGEDRHLAPLLVAGALVGLAFVFACAEGGGRAAVERHQRTAAVVGAGEPLGQESCLLCHGHQPAPRHHLDCESCHGSGRLHVQNVSDPTGIRFPGNAECMACHETGHRGLFSWELSEHERAGLLCSDCHDPHNGEPFHVRMASEVSRNVFPQARADTHLCASCHPSVATRFNLPSRHPVAEGMIGCTDCHGPHEAREVRLGNATEACTQCHQAQAGPWIYEHPPVEEDCGHCHEPHGTSADNLLTATQPGACVYCHTLPEMAATHDPQAYVTRCTDCHNAVHGSYADPHLRR